MWVCLAAEPSHFVRRCLRHTQNLAKSDPATTPAPEEIPWQLLTIHFCAGAGPCGRLRRCYATFPPSVALRHIPPESDFAKTPAISMLSYQKGGCPPMFELAENRLWRSFGLEWRRSIPSMRSPRAEASECTEERSSKGTRAKRARRARKGVRHNGFRQILRMPKASAYFIRP